MLVLHEAKGGGIATPNQSQKDGPTEIKYLIHTS